MARPSRRESDTERRVWDLLTKDFEWTDDLPVHVRHVDGRGKSRSRLQVFEVAVAAIFERLRPDYDWCVTPNRADGGLDFVGRHRFLQDEALGIRADITVGGQCKKRTRVDDVVEVIAGSLNRMAVSENPTFFVVALSARITRRRIKDARETIQRIHHRHCHILDRAQIEGLMQEHLVLLSEILRQALVEGDARDVLAYLGARRERPVWQWTMERPVGRVLAGVPFVVTVDLRSSAVSTGRWRLWWRPRRAAGPDVERVMLVRPAEAETPAGMPITSEGVEDDPISARCSIELVSFAVGDVDLGEVVLVDASSDAASTATCIALGGVRVVENLRPRFYERPFAGALRRLGQEYDRALARGVGFIAVVGAAGSGKSRLCEEFCLVKRRAGAEVVTAKQPKTLDDPHRLLADLFVGLAGEEVSFTDPAGAVAGILDRYDRTVAARAEPALRSIFGTTQASPSPPESDQAILSALLVLIVARARRRPLVIHFQDLHWCPADVLLLLERLAWQLGLVPWSTTAPNPERGVLLAFEGRVRERLGWSEATWTSELFEAFLQKVDSPRVHCMGFGPEDGLAFIERLFEDRYHSDRVVADGLEPLERPLVERIHRSSGGNPFHSLEQVQLLKDRGVLGQNPRTGLLYLLRPEPVEDALPATVFESIHLRWSYLASRNPQLALLLWSVALVDDRVPARLFDRLRRELAPQVSDGDIDATDMLWPAGAADRDIGFRHENYFRALRRVPVSTEDRTRVVTCYCDWFATFERLGPGDQFRWARAALEAPTPDIDRCDALFGRALRAARRSGDVPLTRRIGAARLDLAWDIDDRQPLPNSALLRRCDDELALVSDLLSSDRQQAAHRLEALRERLRRRLAERARTPRVLEELERRAVEAEILRVALMFNDRQPALASEIAAEAVRRVRTLRRALPERDTATWHSVEMEALHAHAVALALCGDIATALRTSSQAVVLAESSPSSASLRVLSTHANILLAEDPKASEAILRGCLADMLDAEMPAEHRSDVQINLAMALVLQAYRLADDDPGQAAAMLDEAAALLSAVSAQTFRLGNYPDAGAAALMLGIVSALRGDGDEVAWFAQAVAAASRGRQMETLWRAHVNFATAQYRRAGKVTPGVCDHARAALEIMEESLPPSARPDASARFALLRVPLAHAVRFLILAGDEQGYLALDRLPALRACFVDVRAGVLHDDVHAFRSHEWLRIEDCDYVIY